MRPGTIALAAFLLALLCAGPALAATAINGDRTMLGTWDASGAASVLPCPVATATPGTCTVGMCFFDSNGPGAALYLCTATNTWTQYVDVTRTISTTAPIAGGGDLSANRTLTCNAASASQAGCLAASDFSAFAQKNALTNHAALGGL